MPGSLRERGCEAAVSGLWLSDSSGENVGVPTEGTAKGDFFFMSDTPRVLTIVIPALDEEDAIGDTIRRCLDARDHIIASSPADEVEIIVVSDGSSDRTEEIAKSFEEVKVLVFEVNRGYGAAIKCGWEHGRGDLLAFLDGDGTCDPNFFADLCSALEEQGADLALGSRMGPESRMPIIRAIGNSFFSWLLSALSKQFVKDTATARGRLPAASGVTGAAAKLFTPRMRLVGGTALLAAALVIVRPASWSS
jgi:hypothetical protein